MTPLKLTRPYEKQDRPPSIETDDDHLVRRCRKCGALYRSKGFPLPDAFLEAVMRVEVRMFGREPDGVCEGCS